MRKLEFCVVLLVGGLKGSNFPFTGGTIRNVTVDVGNDQHVAPAPKFRD